MSQRWIPAVFMRGGTSKGVFFHAKDLPADPAERDRIILAVLGSPDPYGRQLNGMGGGISSLSKAVIVGPPTRSEADADYTFAQVVVDRPVVDYGANCGNLSSAVGPFAVDEGLSRAADGEALIRIHNTNTRRMIHSRFPVRDGLAVVTGDFSIPGVAGTGARIRLDFLDPGGAVTADLLPTGHVTNELTAPGKGTFAVSLVDATNPVAFLAASDLGLSGAESPDEIEAQGEVMALLDTLRRQAGVLMGLGDRPEAVGLSNPKIAVLAAPRPFRALNGDEVPSGAYDIGVRMLSMERAHRAVPLTGAMCLGVACRIEGTIAHALSRRLDGDEIRVGNPSGVVSVGAEVVKTDRWRATSAVVFRTARRLMQGSVGVP